MPANIFSFDQPEQQTGGLSDLLAQSQQQKQTYAQQLMAKALAGDPVYSTKQGMAKMGMGALAGLYEGLDERKKQAAAKANSDQLARLYTSQALRQQADPSGYSLTPPEDKIKGGATPAAPASTDGGSAPGPQASADPAIEGRFIGTLKTGGLTNPNGLAAVAAYAQAESRYSPKNINGSWSDPSESGEPGTSGGILSWRGPRFAAMRAATQGADDPVSAQAQFFLKENPDLTAALQNAKSPDEAHSLMANAWKFAGYDRPGGENANRLNLTRQYLAKVGGGTQTADASPLPAPTDEGTPLEAARGQTADASGQIVPSMPANDGFSGGADAAGLAASTGEPEPTADAGSVTQAPAPDSGPGSIGPNGGVMSAPTDQGASVEMLPLEQGGGYAPAPPPRPDADALAQALKQDDGGWTGGAAAAGLDPQQLAQALKADDTGTPIEAARGKFAYAGDGPVQSDAPMPGLSAPPANYQPQIPLPPARSQMAMGPEVPSLNGSDPAAEGNAPDAGVKVAEAGNGIPRTRSLIPGALPEPKDPRLAPQPGQQPAPAPAPVPTPAPKDLTPANPRQAEPVRPNQAQLTPRAAAALQVLINPNQPGDVKKLAHEIFQSETQAGHEAYDKDGNRFWLVPGKKPELIMAKDKDDTQIIELKDGSRVRVGKSEGAPQPIPGLGPQKSRPLSPAEFPQYNIDPAYKGAVMLGPDGSISFPGKPATEITLDQKAEGAAAKAMGEKVGGAKGDTFKEYIHAYEPAQAKLQALAIMRQAVENPNVWTGAGGEGMLKLNKAAQYLGKTFGLQTDDLKIADAESLDKFARQLAGAQAKSIGGARVTNFELDQFLKSNPGLSMSKDGNTRMIGVMSQLAQREADLSQMASDFTEGGGGKLSDFRKQVETYDKAHPMVDPITGKKITSVTEFPEHQTAPTPSPTSATAPVVPPPGAKIRTWNAAKGAFE